ncbi:conserved hypothetical protein [Ricinus communis]|uniref:NERD domain-containing protein n=1 Tax=Ricinus communis TaxID=3988 RepID=B9S249_RICCO|nr:conserved hypothetical protein [Ricinus communis]
MWVEILCGLIAYKLFRCFFSDSDDVLELESSDTTALFNVANRLEKLYGGKVYVGLRIPDADTGSRQNVDMVLVTKGEAVVISVKNFSGLVSITGDGSWVCEGHGKHKPEHHPDPVSHFSNICLKSYSVVLYHCVHIFVDSYVLYSLSVPREASFWTIHPSNFPSEVITHDQWVQLKPEPKSMLSGWIKGAFRGAKKEMQESIHEKLNFILSTAPMWDRLELKGNKYVLGEFLEFKGKQEDITALRGIKRSKVSQFIVQKTSMFGLAHSKLQVLYSARDYRSEGTSTSEWNEATVRSSTEVVFQPENSRKVRKFKLSSIISMSLSA